MRKNTIWIRGSINWDDQVACGVERKQNDQSSTGRSERRQRTNWGVEERTVAVGGGEMNRLKGADSEG